MQDIKVYRKVGRVSLRPGWSELTGRRGRCCAGGVTGRKGRGVRAGRTGRADPDSRGLLFPDAGGKLFQSPGKRSALNVLFDG